MRFAAAVSFCSTLVLYPSLKTKIAHPRRLRIDKNARPDARMDKLKFHPVPVPFLFFAKSRKSLKLGK